MSRKERTKTRRNNYRAWKQAQKQKQKSATPAASAAAAPPAEPPSPATAPQVEEEPKASEPVNIPTAPDSPPPGALIPYNPSARVDLKLLLQRLRLGGPEVTDEERIAIAHRLEQHVASTYGGLIDPKEIEGSRQKLRSLLTHALSRFGIPWPAAGESEPAPSDEAPGHSFAIRLAVARLQPVVFRLSTRLRSSFRSSSVSCVAHNHSPPPWTSCSRFSSGNNRPA